MDTVKVHLGGMLGRLFGKEWDLHVASPAEAIRAIDVNTKGKLREYLSKNNGQNKYGVSLQEKKNSIGSDELKNRSGSSDIFIYPIIKGKNSGWAKVIIGAILVIAGVLLYAWNPIVGTILVSMGASLILGGITQLLTPVPKQNQQLQSYNFQGNATVVQQGGCIPVFYGRYLVSPLPICIAIKAEDISATSNVGGGTIITNPIPGGSVNQLPGDSFYPVVPGLPPDIQNPGYQLN